MVLFRFVLLLKILVCVIWILVSVRCQLEGSVGLWASTGSLLTTHVSLWVVEMNSWHVASVT